MRARMRFLGLAAAVLSAGAVGPAPAADEQRQMHQRLKADALALEKRVQRALEETGSGQVRVDPALVRDLDRFAERTRRRAESAPAGSYLNEHLAGVADTLDTLVGELRDAQEAAAVRELLERAVSALFWGFRG